MTRAFSSRLRIAKKVIVRGRLEVTGRVSMAAEVLYLKAGNVALIPRPPEAETPECAP